MKTMRKFDEVVGQEQVVQVLTESIKQKKISHAYLFCGGRGTGKTTVARIVARDIGCNPEDIIEIDAASNRGIDEVRVLREAVRTAPFSSPYKVYIIDEAHMLTKEAANALLKTLEEPPAHVVFILATTDPEKLPETIVSRCQKIVFKIPSISTLSTRLIDIAQEEGRSLSTEAGEAIAKHGKGSYRDALGVLEQVFAVSSKKISYEDIVTLLGTPHRDEVFTILKSIGDKNASALLASLDRVSQASPLALYDECLELIRIGLEERVKVSVSPIMKDIVGAHPHLFTSKVVLELLQKRSLLDVSRDHAWIALTAIFLSLIGE
jgi:DNA polymerase-3 subunit gamma/tau